MKRLLVSTALFLICISAQAQNTRKEITVENIKSLIGMTSDQLSIMGFHTAMTRHEAKVFLAKSKTLLGERDDTNRDRIYVYQKNSDDSKGKCLLYLIWDGRSKMRAITIFEDASPLLTENFQRLMSAEAVDPHSTFMRSFIGQSDSSKVTLDIPSIRTKNTTHRYSKVGIEVTKKQNEDKETYVIALIRQESWWRRFWQ